MKTKKKMKPVNQLMKKKPVNRLTKKMIISAARSAANQVYETLGAHDKVESAMPSLLPAAAREAAAIGAREAMLVFAAYLERL